MFKVARAPLFRGSSVLAEEFECPICLDLAERPVECEVCKQKFCFDCAMRWTLNSSACPKKCSDQWYFREVADCTQLQTSCPFSTHPGEQLQIDLQNLQNHMEACSYRPESLRKRQRLRQECVCRNGHKLQLYISSYANMIKGKCIQCGQQNLCRLYCPECNGEKYCIGCRIVSFTKEICPTKSHALNQINNRMLLCDRCGAKPYHMHKPGFYDNGCDLALCGPCMEIIQAIPEQPPQIIQVEKQEVPKLATEPEVNMPHNEQQFFESLDDLLIDLIE